MIPGKEQYYQCPECENVLSRGSLVSGNTIGAVLYSDAKSIARMLPQFPQISKCCACGCIFWLKENLRVYPTDSSKAKTAMFLSLDEYFEALHNNVYSSIDEEIYIRQHIWWKFNDRSRKGNKLFLDDNDEQKWKQNLCELENLLDSEDTTSKLLVIEINRSLGKFDKCKYLLGEVNDPNLNWVVEKFAEEIEKKNTFVVQL